MTFQEMILKEIEELKKDLTRGNLNQEAITANQQEIIRFLQNFTEMTEAQTVYTAAMTDTLIGG